MLSEYYWGWKNTKGAARTAPLVLWRLDERADLEIHAAHAAAARHRRGGGQLLPRPGDHGLRRPQKAGDRSRLLQPRAPHLGGVAGSAIPEVHLFPRPRGR